MSDKFINPAAQKVISCYDHAKASFEDARADTEKCIRYVNQDQWDASLRAQAKIHGKPYLTYNIIFPILSTLLGNEQLSRRKARFKPTGAPENVALADIVQGRFNAICDEQDLEELLQSAFFTALAAKTGGWIQRRFEINELGYLDFKYEVLNTMRIFPDPETRCSDYSLQKCRWIVKEGWEPLDVIKEIYGVTPQEKDKKKIRWWEELTTIFKRFTDETYSSDTENYDKENDRYKILEIQERVARKVYSCYDQDTDQYFSLTPDEFRLFAKQMNLRILREDYDARIHTIAVLPYFNDQVIYDQDCPIPVANFDVMPVFSTNFDIQLNEASSLVYMLLDIQDDINKGKSQNRDYVTQILSGGMYVSARETETIKQMRKKGNQPNQVYAIKDMAHKPERQTPGVIPPEIMMNSENSYEFASRVSSQNAALQGKSERSGESGNLFEQKVQRAAAAVNPYFKALANTRKTIAKDFIDCFPFVYSEQDRLVDTKQKDKFVQVPINIAINGKIYNDVNNLSLQVELDEGTDSVTVKEENFEKNMAIANLVAQVDPAYVDLITILGNAPIPDRDKWIQHINTVKQNSGQAAAQQNQLDTTKQITENQKIQHGMMIEEEKLRLDAEKLKNQPTPKP